MKFTFSHKTLDKEIVRELTKFAINQVGVDHKGLRITVKNSKRTYAGTAWRITNRIICRIHHDLERFKDYKICNSFKSQDFVIKNIYEMYLWLVSHELRHIWDFHNKRKTHEKYCNGQANRVVIAYRKSQMSKENENVNLF